MDNPILAAVLAVLAIPGVTSALTALIRKASDGAGISPRIIVYAVALAITAAIGLTGGLGAVPAFGGDPAAFVAAWLTWAGLTGAAAEAVYRTLQPILAPA